MVKSGEGNLLKYSSLNLSPNVRIIKKYNNRKLYDTKKSAYVTLEDLAVMVKGNEEFIVIENKHKSDITSQTLMQIAFEREKKASDYMPVTTLREIIKTSGSISKFLLGMGLFTEEQMISLNSESHLDLKLNKHVVHDSQKETLGYIEMNTELSIENQLLINNNKVDVLPIGSGSGGQLDI
jgi:polyhydroxyalkanoate synthesis repressor PhaR